MVMSALPPRQRKRKRERAEGHNETKKQPTLKSGNDLRKWLKLEEQTKNLDMHLRNFAF